MRFAMLPRADFMWLPPFQWSASLFLRHSDVEIARLVDIGAESWPCRLPAVLCPGQRTRSRVVGGDERRQPAIHARGLFGGLADDGHIQDHAVITIAVHRRRQAYDGICSNHAVTCPGGFTAGGACSIPSPQGNGIRIQAVLSGECW